MAEGTWNGGPAVIRPKRARLSVWEKLIVVLLALVAVGVVWIGITFVRFRIEVARHEARIAKASQLMKTYGEAEWKELYEECMLLYNDKTAWDKAGKVWPKKVTELNPYGVDLGGNVVSMYWTGGFDEFSLCLRVYPRDFSSSSPIEGPGIWVLDNRDSDDDPKNIYNPSGKMTVIK